MFEPEDFGLSCGATLARVADPKPSRHHVPFWSSFGRAIAADTPHLVPWTDRDRDPADDTATHQYTSHRFVRIGCRLIEPPKPRAANPIRAGLISLHGYDHPIPLVQEEERWAGLAAKGVAVLAIRVRGYPGSLIDTGDWSIPTWIGRGLDVPLSASGPDATDTTPTDLQAWSLPLAISDVINACRALTEFIGPDKPLFLRGESFGGGLAVIATALMTSLRELSPLRLAIARLQIGLPTLGDWSWRLAPERRSHSGGAQREIANLLTLHAAREAELIERLRVCDSAIHAQRVRCPVLCKLAMRDEVVPAPAAAAVYNALYTPPGQKWRFLTPYGHFDGGIRNARRHALFDRCAEDFLDPAQNADEAMAKWEPLLGGGERAPV